MKCCFAMGKSATPFFTLNGVNASPDIHTVLGKVEQAGGKIMEPLIKIPAGLIAVIMDSEGNRVGLHAEK